MYNESNPARRAAKGFLQKRGIYLWIWKNGSRSPLFGKVIPAHIYFIALYDEMFKTTDIPRTEIDIYIPVKEK
jgi:hypothetical protein